MGGNREVLVEEEDACWEEEGGGCGRRERSPGS